MTTPQNAMYPARVDPLVYLGVGEPVVRSMIIEASRPVDAAVTPVLFFDTVDDTGARVMTEVPGVLGAPVLISHEPTQMMVPVSVETCAKGTHVVMLRDAVGLSPSGIQILLA